MVHLETRCPAHITVEVRPAFRMGFIALATDTRTGMTAEAWAEQESDARQRAEYLLNIDGQAK